MMKDVPEFPALSEYERRLMVNAVMIAAGQFGSVKVNRDDHMDLWSGKHNDLLKKLGFPGPGWGPEKNPQAKCAHGCGPAFLDGNRSGSCWECGELILREKLKEETERADRAMNSLNQTWFDADHGPDVWTRPTAEAYARVCVLYRNTQERLKLCDDGTPDARGKFRVIEAEAAVAEWKKEFGSADHIRMIAARLHILEEADAKRTHDIESMLLGEPTRLEWAEARAEDAERDLKVAKDIAARSHAREERILKATGDLLDMYQELRKKVDAVEAAPAV